MANDTCYTCFEEKQLNNDGASCWCDSSLEALAYPKCLRDMLRNAVSHHAAQLPTSAGHLADVLNALDGQPEGAVAKHTRVSSVARSFFDDVTPHDEGAPGRVGGFAEDFMKNVTAFLHDVCKQDVQFYESGTTPPLARISAAPMIVAFKRAPQDVQADRVVSIVLSMPTMRGIDDGHVFSYIRCNDDAEYWMLADAYGDRNSDKGSLVHTTIAFREKGVFNPMGDGLLTSGRFNIRYGTIYANTQSPLLDPGCIIVYGDVHRTAHGLSSAWPPRIPRRDGEGARSAILRHVFPNGQDAKTLKQACDLLGNAAAYSDDADETFVQKAKASGKMCIEVPSYIEDEHHLMAIVLHKDNEWALFDEDDDDTRPALLFESRQFIMFSGRMGAAPRGGRFNIAYHGTKLGLIGAKCAYAI